MKIPRLANEFEYWDVLVNRVDSDIIGVEDERVKVLTKNYSEGIAVRGVYKGSWCMASSNRIEDLEEVFRTALKLGKIGGSPVKIKKHVFKDSTEIKIKKNAFNEELERKLNRLFLLAKTAKNLDKRVKSVQASLSYSRNKSDFYDSEGGMIFQKEFRTSYGAEATGKDGDNIQRVYERDGKTKGLELFYDVDIATLAQVMVEKLIIKLSAKHAPAKKLPVICDNDLTGVFFHEAVGHACEADAVLSDASVFKGLLGKKIASDIVNFVDGPIKDSYGYYVYDDEGVKKKDAVLIEDGFLRGYLHSLDTASKMKMEPTGNGRSMSVFSFPIPRMSTSILKPCSFKKEELFSGVKEGIYATGTTGGQVLPTEGKFIFGAEQAFLIKDGEIATPLRDVNLTGDILKTLKLIDGVSRDAKLSKGGMCGKAGQSVPVDEFAPHIRISEVVIGGRD